MAVLLTAAIAAAADSRLLSLVMPDAKIVGGGDAQKFYSSDFGQFVLSQINLNDQGFQSLAAASGFDYRHDLYEVVFASPGGAGHQHGIAIASGNFDPSRILPLAATGGQISTYKGVQVATGKDHKSVAFLGNSIGMVGDADSVQAAIDQSRQSVPLDPALLAKISQVSAGNHLWFVSNEALSNVVAPGGANGPVQGDALKSVQQTSGSVQFGKSVQVSAEAVAQTNQDASSLADVVRMLVSLMQVNQQNPHTAGAASLLSTLKVQTAANTVKLSMLIPEAQLEQIIQQARPAKAAQKP